MLRTLALAACLYAMTSGVAQEQSSPQKLPSFDYEIARTHELKPHRRTMPHEGVKPGFNQLHLVLTVSPNGDVLHAEATGDDELMTLWPELQAEVYQWKFTPFEAGGKPVAAEAEEYLDLVPPERFPKRHVPPPALKPDSQIAISLDRSGCYGSCPSYRVVVTLGKITFDGRGYVAANGVHHAAADADDVKALARKFIQADFYSMNNAYVSGVTDCPTFVLSISIDGQSKTVTDYVGSWEGMPAIISELEEDVDNLAGTRRWIDGNDGLVSALKAEKYDFSTADAQRILKQASVRGNAKTVSELIDAGVPLSAQPLVSKARPSQMGFIDDVGLLASAGENPEVLAVLIEHSVSKDDQPDKDLALRNAARAGSFQSVRMLLSYGANPNVDLTKLIVTTSDSGFEMQGQGRGSILYYAASSGNPDVVREVLKYHPDLEARGDQGQTALFAAGDWRSTDSEGARVECVKLLLDAGANINARDNDGNTALHEIYLGDVVGELLKRGADVNAQNDDGDTPIVTNVGNDNVLPFLKAGASLNLVNKKGQTMLEAANEKGPLREKALQEAMAALRSQ